VDDLTLQIGLVHNVEIDDADGADAGRGQVEQSRRAEPAGTDDQDPCVLEPLLPVNAQVGNYQVTAVPRDFIATQLGCGLD
jgi:hypothetical protein